MSANAPRRANAGQTIVIFALISLLLLAGTGLVLDGGYDFLMRRTMQNAADAAAFAGARLIARDSTTNTVAATVNAVAVQNGVPSSANVTCQYITDSNTDGVAPCQLGVALPTNLGIITGVRVAVSEQHPTFVMRAVGNPTSGTGASAAAQVQTISGYPGSAVPFIPCGLDTDLVGGGTFSLLKTKQAQIGTDRKGNPIYQTVVDNDSNGYATLDPAAYAYDFEQPSSSGLPYPGSGVAPAAGKPFFAIHGPQIARCGAGSANFKGLNATTGTITLPAAYTADSSNPAMPIAVDNGVKAGPTRSRRVPGVLGCEVNQYDGCVMVLPVVDDSGPGGSGNSIVFAGRLWAAFWVKQTGANTHGAYLIANYPITATGATGWTPGYSGPVTTRLIR